MRGAPFFPARRVARFGSSPTFWRTRAATGPDPRASCLVGLPQVRLDSRRSRRHWLDHDRGARSGDITSSAMVFGRQMPLEKLQREKPPFVQGRPRWELCRSTRGEYEAMRNSSR